MRRAISMSLVLACASLGCGAASEPYPVVVRATRDGDPMRGVEITEAGLMLGETGADGALSLAAERPEGAQIELEARCPEGYRARPEVLTARLRHLARNGDANPPLELEVRCEERIHEVVVVVDAGRPGLEVLVDGRVVDRTGEAGLAHLWLEQPAGRRIAVQIDTSAYPDLVPPSPEQRYTVTSDEVFYWGRPFDAEDDRERGRGGRGGRGGRDEGGPVEIERIERARGGIR